MLNNNLNTNEVKDRSGTECEFNRLSQNARSTEFALITETPSLPYRLSISHQEIGTGLKKRRRSVVRFDKTTVSDVDDITPITTSAFLVLDAPVGASETANVMKDVIANLLSFCATTGAGTTVLFDCTGNGADALIKGGL